MSPKKRDHLKRKWIIFEPWIFNGSVRKRGSKGNKNWWMEGNKQIHKSVIFRITENRRDKGISRLVGKYYSTIFANLSQIQSQPRCNGFLDRKYGPGILRYLRATCLNWPNDRLLSGNWYNTGSTMYCCTTALLGAHFRIQKFLPSLVPRVKWFLCLNDPGKRRVNQEARDSSQVLDDAGCGIFLWKQSGAELYQKIWQKSHT